MGEVSGDPNHQKTGIDWTFHRQNETNEIIYIILLPNFPHLVQWMLYIMLHHVAMFHCFRVCECVCVFVLGSFVGWNVFVIELQPVVFGAWFHCSSRKGSCRGWGDRHKRRLDRRLWAKKCGTGGAGVDMLRSQIQHCPSAVETNGLMASDESTIKWPPSISI